MRRLAALSLLLLIAATGCTDLADPTDGSVRGLGFAEPISNTALRQLEDLGNILSLSHSARVVIMLTNASPAKLGEVSGRPDVGPDLGKAEGLILETEAGFASGPSESDLQALAAIGTITVTIPANHSAFLMVPVRDIGRLDSVPNISSVWVGYDPIQPQ